MNEKPILFNGEMVRAILDGRKTVTRRVVKFPKHVPPIVIPDIASVNPDGRGDWVAWSPKPVTDEQSIKRYPNGGGFKCPYGRPGDLLWVRETFKYLDKERTKVCYQATPDDCHDGVFIRISNWTPSIFMPRWASRLTLRVTAVRVERLQEITNDEVYAEGSQREYADGIGPMSSPPGMGRGLMPPRSAFRLLWDSINAKRGYSWDSNPFVWVVSFERVD